MFGMQGIRSKGRNFICQDDFSNHQCVGPLFGICIHLQPWYYTQYVCIPTRSSYKGLYCVMEYVSRNKTKIVVKKYDKHFFILHLMKLFKHLNLELKPNPTLSTFGIDDSL
jgi:hypothetical protein